MLETSSKAKDNKRTLSDLQEEIIAIQSKAIAVLEENAKLLRENAELKEKALKLELQTCDTMHVPPIRNGVLEIVKEPVK